MTTEQIVREIRHQIDVLRRDYRLPKDIHIGAEYMPELLCATEFFADTTFYGNGSIVGCRVMAGRPGEVTVIPEDWPGYGQGEVRPR